MSHAVADGTITEKCPRCETVRPLAWQLDDAIVCASCAGVASIFTCSECGREEHPTGSTDAPAAFLRERLTELLTDPISGTIHHRLRPVFDELINADRPQTVLWWLRKARYRPAAPSRHGLRNA